MRLNEADPIFETIARRLDARLDPRSPRPLAVAFSGGGDSLALLLATQRWAARCGRPLVCLTVDHGLRPESSLWAETCARRAGQLGIEHRTVLWNGEKPRAGVSAAARGKRHALLADAAREAGAAVLMMGHTADDVLEAGAMREAGSTVSSPREWSPSPAWPEGRGVFLLRPTLGLRRAELRAALSALGETWIDDPSNVDPMSLRARVRMQGVGCLFPEEPTPPDLQALHARTFVDCAGRIAIPSEVLVPSNPAARAFLAAALLCAAGTERPPRTRQLDAILDRSAGGTQDRTLAGARVRESGRVLSVFRDHGSLERLKVEAPQDRAVVFDGRFELVAATHGFRLAAAAGRLARLPPAERAALKALPPAVRPSLPLAIGPDGAVCCPILDPGRWRVRNLVETRLMAACGVIQDEVTLSRVGETDREPLNQGALSEGLVHELA